MKSIKKIIAEGDEALAAANYSGAKTAFEKAGGLKPSEAYPKTKLKEIEGNSSKRSSQRKSLC